MTTTTGTTERGTVNGVDVATLFATIDAVRSQPELAQFRFRALNEWVSGTHSRGRFPGFRVTFEVDGDGDAEQLAALVAQSQARSAVFDVLTNGTAVTVEVAR